jgi:hypothetical protein
VAHPTSEYPNEIPAMPQQPLITLAALSLALLATPARAGEHSSFTLGDGPMIAGSGKVVSQSRQTGAFDSVQTKGAVDLDIVIGAQTAVAVDMDDNLQTLIRTEVHGKTLVIDSKGSWSSDHDPHVRIVLPALSAVDMEGSGNAMLKGLNGGELALRVDGSGDIDASGHVASLAVLLNGSGDARLGPLQADTAKVRINGSGDVTINAAQTLEASVYGSGDVHYRGNPSVSSHVHGSGSVEKQ